MFKTSVFILSAMLVAMPWAAQAQDDAAETCTGVVFDDENRNGIQDENESGVQYVAVSNSRDVVATDAEGRYRLDVFDGMTVFVVKPSGYMTPVDENNVPQFFYHHKPAGSPAEIQRFQGLAPTGELPESIDFPLYRYAEGNYKFKAVMIGDTQTYNDREITYLRDSLVNDVKNNAGDAVLAISMGDNVGDQLDLYPRYLSVMGEMGMPVYYVPGNHDLDFDAEDDSDSFDTFKSYVGPAYYSFNYGLVHFVILDDVVYPSPEHSTEGSKLYNGKIDETQLEWLKNDLARVPEDRLIVLNQHIPILSDVDRAATRHNVDNRQELFDIVEGRKVLALAGHTHTLSHFLPGDELEGWGHATPIHETIVGAACGSWWSGDLDDAKVPYSYQRCGTPRNYLVYEFNGTDYTDTFKSTIQGSQKQMHMGFMTFDMMNWYLNMDASGFDAPLEFLENRHILTQQDLIMGYFVVNFYAGGSNSTVACSFDDGEAMEASKSLQMWDPVALANQMYILRGVPGFALWDASAFGTGSTYGPDKPVSNDEWMRTVSGRSTHLWYCDIPQTLSSGPHKVSVTATDIYGKQHTETMSFEVE